MVLEVVQVCIQCPLDHSSVAKYSPPVLNRSVLLYPVRRVKLLVIQVDGYSLVKRQGFLDCGRLVNATVTRLLTEHLDAVNDSGLLVDPLKTSLGLSYELAHGLNTTFRLLTQHVQQIAPTTRMSWGPFGEVVGPVRRACVMQWPAYRAYSLVTLRDPSSRYADP